MQIFIAKEFRELIRIAKINMNEIYTYTHVYLCSDVCTPEPHQLVTFTDMDIKQRCQNQVP